MLRHKMAALIGALGLFSTVFLYGGVAQAQGYPPPTTVPTCIAGNINAGNVAVGQTITFPLCGDFTTGTTTVTVNGTRIAIPAKAEVNGVITVVVTVVSQTVLQINDPVNAAAVCGTNTVNVTSTGTPGTATGTFNLVCTTAVTSSSALPLTGADVLGIVLVGLVLVGLGTVLVVAQRRRRQAI